MYCVGPLVVVLSVPVVADFLCSSDERGTGLAKSGRFFTEILYQSGDDKMKVKIVQQELKEDGILTTYSNGHVEMLPYLIDENGEEYVEMFPNDAEQH